MAGFGAMPFGVGPFGSVYTTPSQPSTTYRVASRKFDGNGRLVQRSNGDAEGMNNTIQRAVILMAIRAPAPDIIGADFASQREADIRKALEILTDTEKVLEIESISVSDDGHSSTQTHVALRDLIDGKVYEYTL